jgi:hypothetical protein
MPLNTLKNISVPTGPNQNAAILMPKLQYRFRVRTIDFGDDSGADQINLTKEVIDVTRPNLSFEQITIDAYNSRSYLAGKHTWEPVTVNLRDDASNNIQRIVGNQLQKQFDFANQSSARAGVDYKFQMLIEILDGGNAANFSDSNVIDRFHLVGAYIESANYNQLAYSTNDPVQIALTIRYDNAIQFSRGGSLSINDAEGIGAEFDLNRRSVGTDGNASIGG